MTITIRYVMLTLIVALLGFWGPAKPAYAQGTEHTATLQGRKPANLLIEPLKPFVLGDHPIITVELTAEFGHPIPNQPIFIFIDGIRKAEGRTDTRGVASIPLRYKYAAGSYHVKAVYPGIQSIGVNRAIAEADIVVEPAKVAVYTVPAMPGITFKLNNKIYTSDENGVAQFDITTSG